jgi:hypothetical protein
MAKNEKKQRRALTFRVVDADKKAIVAIPFETAASNKGILDLVMTLIERIKESHRITEASPQIRRIARAFERRRITHYVHDSQTNQSMVTMCVPAQEGETLEAYAVDMARRLDNYFTSRLALGVVYREMAEYMKRRGWTVKTVTAARWREVCALHPLYLYAWDESRKRAFEITAKNSLQRGIKDKRYGSGKKRAPRKSASSSSKKRDGIALIRERSSLRAKQD